MQNRLFLKTNLSVSFFFSVQQLVCLQLLVACGGT